MDEYMTEYFGTTEWYSSVTTQSGIDMMITDLEMMARGLSINLNYITEIERDLTASGVEITDTKSLFDEINYWAINQNTNYAAVLLAEFSRLLAKREPVLQLRNWFDIDMEQAEILWKTITIYHEITNLNDAYIRAVEARRIELEELSDINLEGEDI
jgi:hypothetical protein